MKTSTTRTAALAGSALTAASVKAEKIPATVTAIAPFVGLPAGFKVRKHPRTEGVFVITDTSTGGKAHIDGGKDNVRLDFAKQLLTDLYGSFGTQETADAEPEAPAKATRKPKAETAPVVEPKVRKPRAAKIAAEPVVEAKPARKPRAAKVLTTTVTDSDGNPVTTHDIVKRERARLRKLIRVGDLPGAYTGGKRQRWNDYLADWSADFSANAVAVSEMQALLDDAAWMELAGDAKELGFNFVKAAKDAIAHDNAAA